MGVVRQTLFVKGKEATPDPLKKFGRANGKEPIEVSREARDLLLRHEYPGNIRERENLVERAVVLARGNLITFRDIPFHLKDGLEESETPPSPSSDLPLLEQLDALEKFLIRQALKETEGVQTRAADRLGISERVLRYKLKKYGM